MNSLNLSVGININANNNLQSLGGIAPNALSNVNGLSLPNMMDRSSLSSLGADPFNGSFANMFGNSNPLSSLGFGNIPGFGNACNPSGSMFGGLMQMLDNQSKMINMMMMMMMMMIQKQTMNGFAGLANALGGGIPGMGSCGMPGMGGANGANGANGPSGANGANGPSGVAGANPLSGDDRKTAAFIDDWLKKKGSPAAGQNTGALMVQQGKANGVDPLILLAIAGLETQYGKTGIGVNGMLGVGAYDSDPNNATRNPHFSGVNRQVTVGAKTFKNLLAKGGGNNSMPVAQQLNIVGKKWATASHWSKAVLRVYNQIVAAAKNFKG